MPVATAPAPAPEEATGGWYPPGRERLGERGFVLAVTVVFAVLCALPYGLAHLATPPGWTFSSLLINDFDQTFYLAAQRSAADDLPARNRFTSEPGAPGPVSPLYPFLGEVEEVTHLPGTLVYHLPRLVAGVALPLLLAWFYRLCFPDRPDLAAWSLLLSLFVAGLATLGPWIPGADRASDGVPEANVLYSFMSIPHFAVAWVGIVMGVGAVLMAVRGRPAVAIAAVAATAGLLLSISHTFLVLPLALVLAATGAAWLVAVARRRARFTSLPRLLAAGASIAVAVPFVLAFQDELNRFEALQDVPFPPRRPDALWTWVAGYGLVSPLAAAGLLPAVRRARHDPAMATVLVWVAVVVLLIVTPTTLFQRRFAEGLVVGLAAVAALGLAALLTRSDTPRTVALVVAGLLVLCGVAAAGRAGLAAHYIAGEQQELWRVVEPGDLVLAGDRVAYMLPAYSPGTVYLGRFVETLHRATKDAERDRYAGDARAEEARRWLRDRGITMVVVDEGDPSFRPRGVDDPGPACLRVALRNRMITAYRVVPGCP